MERTKRSANAFKFGGLRQINEIQHRVLAQILALSTRNERRYPDDVLISIMLEHEDKHLEVQAWWAFNDALKRICEFA
jgi:hypothetical protein